jgi:hypothetical protein
MDKNTRREFLAQVGLTIGALTIGKNIMNAGTHEDSLVEMTSPIPGDVESLASSIDSKYAPAYWQSTYCFPDDPYKSLVGKYGELLYGHPGAGADEKIFPHVVSVGIAGRDPLKYIEQKLETPSIPIITTKLDGGDVMIQLTSFATNDSDEHRVDNLMIEVHPKNSQLVSCTPEIAIKSASIFFVKEESNYSSVHIDTPEGKIFFVADCKIESTSSEGVHHFKLQSGDAKAEKPLKYFVRFPQEGQEYDAIEDGLEEPEDLIKDVRIFWNKWQPTEGTVKWEFPNEYQNFEIASARNIQQSRAIKDGKKIFQVGPTVYRGLWVVDGHFLLEAARYLGYDKEAKEGLISIWDRQDKTGLITGGAGEAHWKDTAVAVYALVRQAELSQDWKLFDELYPDAVKAMLALQDLKNKAMNDGSTNGQYKIMPKGFGDSGIGGIRDEYTNTIWTLIALKALQEVGDRRNLPDRVSVRDFYSDLRAAFFDSTKSEFRQHPAGFFYLPMLMKSDPKWSETDPRKQPRPQAAQIYLSHAIYPGRLFLRDNKIVNGYVELMKTVMKEDIPSETGWMPNDAVWTYNAAVVAQTFLWLLMPNLARKTFIGFLNHASPLYAWREEQSLQGIKDPDFIGDMPHNWASAECIRYFRHMMILEDDKALRLFSGVGSPELFGGKKLELIDSPTKWGRISLSIEQVDQYTWHTKFKHGEYDKNNSPTFNNIILPRKLASNIGFNRASGVKSNINGNDVLVSADSNEWECEWKSYDSKKIQRK